MSRYLDRPDQWDALATKLRAAGRFGLDTEFYGLNVRKQSTVGRARVHVWSVAVSTGNLTPRGFRRAVGYVLPAVALHHPAMRAVLEDASVRKLVHNQPVDDHAIHNEGINLRGCVNTLALARWVWPGLVAGGGFGLKFLMGEKLGRDPVCEYLDVVSWSRVDTITVEKAKAVKRCSCGVEGCRRRKGDHAKTPATITVAVDKEVKRKGEYPLESILPGHERWELLVRYAGEDAIAACELFELMLAELKRLPAPFPFGGQRPMFNQDIENVIVEMERAGVLVDVALAERMIAEVESDERTELDWLHGWFRSAGSPLPRDDQSVDTIWSSHKQLTELAGKLGWPRSPIWKKGRVKRDDIKFDSAALDWIAKAHEPAREMIGHLLRLKKIRSSKKYFQLAVKSGGCVNPVCGPMSDGDDRNGAVTGRLGIKGEMPLMQLPVREDADPYRVRRMIVANGNTNSSREVNELEVA